MHQTRRRKKRSSYGVRTVEISRGNNGFGFTISGQAPCILSCIVGNSPAEKAGLRPGDFLIAVNGLNVSKVLHDDVVRLIGSTTGILKLQIAENYYSDSSDEEIVPNPRLKPKYLHRLRNRQQACRAEKVVKDLQTGALFIDHLHIGTQPDGTQEPCLVIKQTGFDGTFRLSGPSNKAILDLILNQGQKFEEKPNHRSTITDFLTVKTNSGINGIIHPLKPPLKSATCNGASGSSENVVGTSFFNEQDLNNYNCPSLIHLEHIDEDIGDVNNAKAVLRAVVGYLGTIEMPKDPQLPSSRLQAIRNCIRRLRIEKKIHTLVLLSIFPESVLLTNPHGLMLAEFPAEKITFSGVYADDRKFFGLVTSHGASSDELSEGSLGDPVSISSSCHVFLVDPKLQPHHVHLKRAKVFRISCTPHPITNRCQEFPDSADVILQAIVGLYRSRMGLNLDAAPGLAEFNVHASPQPSNTSSNSSNSDSGIGFRDEGNTSDQVFVVDVENYNRYRTNSLDRQSFPVPTYNLLGAPFRLSNVIQANFPLNQGASNNPIDLPQVSGCSTPSPVHEITLGASGSGRQQADRLTVRAMPDLPSYERSCSTRNTTFVNGASNIRQSAVLHNNTGIFENKLKSDLKPKGATVKKSKKHFKNEQKFEKRLEDRLSPKVYDLGFMPAHIQNKSDYIVEKSVSVFDDSSIITGRGFPHSIDDLNLDSEASSSQLHRSQQLLDRTLTPRGDSQGFEASRKWSRTSSLRRHLRRKRSIHRTPHDAGTMSDGELTNGTGNMSSCSSLMRLDHISDTGSTMGGSSCNSERPVDVGRVGSWAAGFNYLLDDSAGLHTFSEFLKKEFSQENILFWIACERYKKLSIQKEMNEIAKDIYTKHLSIGASEPVNVDSHARQTAQEGLEKPTSDIFIPAQKQIFNLMKFDCYQRFLKSQIFKECMMLDMQGSTLPYNGEELMNSMETKAFHVEGKQSSQETKDYIEDKKRKSLLPWGRSKSKSTVDHNNKKGNERNSFLRRSNNKKKKKESVKLQAEDPVSDLTGSISSLASSEPSINGQGLGRHAASRESLNSVDLTSFPGQCGKEGFLCRVILPDRSTTVVKTQTGESVSTMLQRLLDRRGLTFTAVDVYMAKSDKPLDQSLDVASLGCKEVRVEQRVLFRLDLPEDTTVGVKAKLGRVCGDVLGPILLSYGIKMDDVFMRVAGSNLPVVFSTPVHMMDNQRIIVKLKNDFHGWDNELNEHATQKRTLCNSIEPVMDEVTNEIFQLLLKGRSSSSQQDELRDIDNNLEGNDYESKNDSTLREQLNCNDSRNEGFVMRRNSTGGGKTILGEKSSEILLQQHQGRKLKLDGVVGPVPGSGAGGDSGMARMSLLEALSVRAHSPPTRQMVQNIISGKPETDDLLEMWKRSQCSRLDDQRGTEINSELPDFLKISKEKQAARIDKGVAAKSVKKTRQRATSKERLLELSKRGTGLTNLYPNSNDCFDPILSSTLQDDYFSNAYRNRSNYGLTNKLPSFEDSRLAPGVSVRSKNPELRIRSASCLPAPENQYRRIPQRPASNPLPHLMYPRQSPVCRSPPYFQTGNFYSPEMLDNLLLSSMEGFDLDFELDVTLKASSTPDVSDDSFTPTKIPQNESNNVRASGNYFPTPTTDSAIKLTPSLGRWYKCDPPPLLPKVKNRGPPPRPPSRQHLNSTPSFADLLTDEPKFWCNGTTDNQDLSRRKSKMVDSAGNRADRFNISFV